MEIYIDNELLDMPAGGGEITETITNIRFCESVLSDDFTTDFDVPLTRKNRRLLGLYTEFYKGHPQRVACVAYKRGERYTAQLTVNSTTDTTANVTLFTPVLFASIDSLSLWRLQVDSASTIYKWAEDAAALDTVPFPKYISEKGNIAGCYARHAVATHTDIMQGFLATQGGNLSLDESEFVAVGWDLQDLTVVATKKTVCPQNPTQCILAISESGTTDFSIFGGQHIVNDLKMEEQPTYSGGQWLPNGTVQSFTFNRSCNATVTVEKWNKDGIYDADIYINGVAQNMVDNTGGSGSVTSKTTTKTFNEGDVLTIVSNQMSGDKFIMVKFVYSDYNIAEADYEEELDYLPVSADWSAWGATLAPSHTDWSFSYFGLWCNMPDISVKSYLTTVSWVTGMQYVLLQGPPLTLKLTALDTNVKTLEREWVESIAMTSGRVGKLTWIRYRDSDYGRKVLTAKGDGLEDNKALFTSDFAPVLATRENGKGYVPIYEMEQDAEVLDAHNWKVNYTDCEAVIGLLYYNPDLPISTLGVPPALSNMGFGNFNGIVEIQGWTRQDIRRDSTIAIDGVKFALTEVEWEDSTDQFHYTAIKINITEYETYTPPTPGNQRHLVGIKIDGNYYIIGEKVSTDYNLIGK